MPDMTMCNGHGCKLKESCYRYRAFPSDWQQYFVESPIVDGHCDDYWPISKNRVREMNAIEKELD